MNENAKRAILGIVIVAALVAAGLGAKQAFSSEEMRIEGSTPMPPGFKSEKEKALEAQKAGGVAPVKEEERDLGG